jgi:hypothetical protein
MLELPTQIGFAYLSVPELQPAACVSDEQTACALGNREYGSKSLKAETCDMDSYVPVNNISPEAYALLAAKSVICCHVDTSNMRHNEITLNGSSSTSLASDEIYDPERTVQILEPPKRFYRTFWRSASHRLLRRWAYAARPSSK